MSIVPALGRSPPTNAGPDRRAALERELVPRLRRSRAGHRRLRPPRPLPGAGPAWYWACLVGPDRPLVTVIDHDVALPRAALARDPHRGAVGRLHGRDPARPRERGRRGLRRRRRRPRRGLRRPARRSRPARLRPRVGDRRRSPTPIRASTRYEVPCRVHGEVLVGQERIELDGHGQRDHSWGVRDWWSDGWSWTAGRLDDGTRFHGVDVDLAGDPLYGTGYTQARRLDAGHRLRGHRAALGDHGLPGRRHLAGGRPGPAPWSRWRSRRSASTHRRSPQPVPAGVVPVHRSRWSDGPRLDRVEPAPAPDALTGQAGDTADAASASHATTWRSPPAPGRSRERARRARRPRHRPSTNATTPAPTSAAAEHHRQPALPRGAAPAARPNTSTTGPPSARPPTTPSPDQHRVAPRPLGRRRPRRSSCRAAAAADQGRGHQGHERPATPSTRPAPLGGRPAGSAARSVPPAPEGTTPALAPPVDLDGRSVRPSSVASQPSLRSRWWRGWRRPPPTDADRSSAPHPITSTVRRPPRWSAGRHATDRPSPPRAGRSAAGRRGRRRRRRRIR